MSTPKRNKTSRTVGDQKLIAGVEKHFTATSLFLEGKSYTAAEAVALLQERLDVTSTADAAYATWLSKVDAERAKVTETKKFVSALRKLVVAMFGSSVETLADFGIAPRKQPAALKTEDLSLKVARQRATRAARHTLGSKQRSKIVGEVPVTTPTAAAPATASSSTPVTGADASNGAPHP